MRRRAATSRSSAPVHPGRPRTSSCSSSPIPTRRAACSRTSPATAGRRWRRARSTTAAARAATARATTPGRCPPAGGRRPSPLRVGGLRATRSHGPPAGVTPADATKKLDHRGSLASGTIHGDVQPRKGRHMTMKRRFHPADIAGRASSARRSWPAWPSAGRPGRPDRGVQGDQGDAEDRDGRQIGGDRAPGPLVQAPSPARSPRKRAQRHARCRASSPPRGDGRGGDPRRARRRPTRIVAAEGVPGGRGGVPRLAAHRRAGGRRRRQGGWLPRLRTPSG